MKTRIRGLRYADGVIGRMEEDYRLGKVTLDQLMRHDYQKNENGLDFPTFMTGLMEAPFDYSICPDCGGIGWKPEMCCNGQECGCHGMPVSFDHCTCGNLPADDFQIMEWAKKYDERNAK